MPDPRCLTRGQTSIDLLLAVVLFFLGVSLIIIQASSFLGITTVGTAQQPEVADSIRERLRTETLSDPHQTGLATKHVTTFFGKSDDTLSDQFGPSDYGIAVTLTNKTGHVLYRRGNSPNAAHFNSSAWTSLNRKSVKLTVTMWPT